MAMPVSKNSCRTQPPTPQGVRTAVESGDLAAGYRLEWTARGLVLRDLRRPRQRPVAIDTRGRRRTSRRDLLIRAVGSRTRTVIDATAGFGADALHLTAAGISVVAIERVAVIAAMLDDCIGRLPAEWSSRLTVIPGDAIDLLPQMTAVDAVYLDPMYPGHDERRARPGKRAVILRDLAGADADAVTLFRTARAVARRRVVVKRPLKGAVLADQPSFSLHGITVRYDVYVVA